MQRLPASELTGHPDGQHDESLISATAEHWWRFPDKPKLEIDRSALDGLPRAYLVQVKVDGWRCVVRVTDSGPFEYLSREMKIIPISPNVSGQFEESVRSVDIPAGTIFDAEWVARRPACRDEMLVAFDIMQHGDRPLWNEPAQNRIELLHHLFVPFLMKYLTPTEFPFRSTFGGYREFFDGYRDKPWAEGIVLKRLDSTYTGSVRQCSLNPAWLKCKWRKGEDGMSPVA